MAKFITRVELYDAKKEDYEILTEVMERTGFSTKLLALTELFTNCLLQNI